MEAVRVKQQDSRLLDGGDARVAARNSSYVVAVLGVPRCRQEWTPNAG